MSGAIRRFIGQWPTPESDPVDTVCRVIFIPNDQRILSAVDGALSLLLKEEYWRNEGMTVEDTVELLDVMFDDYIVSSGSCPVELQTQTVIVRHQQNNNVNGGASVAAAWTPLPMNLLERDDTAEASLSPVVANSIVLPSGWYNINASHVLYNGATSIAKIRLKFVKLGVTGYYYSKPERTAVQSTVSPRITLLWALDELTTVTWEYRSSVAQASTGLGFSSNFGDPEIYGEIQFNRVQLVTP